MMRSIAASASVGVVADDDALARGEAVGLDDDRVLARFRRSVRAGSGWSKTRNSAVGTSACRISFLAKTLLASSWAAALVGPKMRRPAFWKASTMPSASGSSGPTTVRPMFSFLAKRIELVEVVAARWGR